MQPQALDKVGVAMQPWRFHTNTNDQLMPRGTASWQGPLYILQHTHTLLSSYANNRRLAQSVANRQARIGAKQAGTAKPLDSMYGAAVCDKQTCILERTKVSHFWSCQRRCWADTGVAGAGQHIVNRPQMTVKGWTCFTLPPSSSTAARMLLAETS